MRSGHGPPPQEPYRNGMSTTSDRADRATKRGRVRVEAGAKPIRAYLGGELVADTIHPLLVWEVEERPSTKFG
jgi:hypothetical protein